MQGQEKEWRMRKVKSKDREGIMYDEERGGEEKDEEGGGE
jgi:hypothetical protein